MANYDYDVITVGGGIGGASVAKALAKKGLRVLVTEREESFKDRIRGEWLAPWGGAEAQMLGLYDLLIEKCAHPQPYFNFGGFMRDLRITTPQKLPALTFYHASMQTIVLEAALAAGAEVRRGVTVKNVTVGKRPSVSIESLGEARELTARLVVCADGRSSAGRSWGEFAVKRGRQRLLGAGILLDNLAVPDDTSVAVMNPMIGRVAYLFPQGERRVRAYLMYGEEEVGRLQGESAVGRFVAACAQTGIPAETYADSRPAGPLASFDMTESWVEHPYQRGTRADRRCGRVERSDLGPGHERDVARCAGVEFASADHRRLGRRRERLRERPRPLFQCDGYDRGLDLQDVYRTRAAQRRIARTGDAIDRGRPHPRSRSWVQRP